MAAARPAPRRGGGRAGPAPDKGASSSEGAGCRRRKLGSRPPPARGRAGEPKEPARRPGKPPRKLRARLTRTPRRPRRDPARGAPRTLTGQLLVARIPARLRDPGRGGEVCVCGDGEQTARRFVFLASRPSPARGSWPRSRALRSCGRRERRGARFVVRSRRARRKSERAARLVLLVEAAAAAPPDGPSASHRLWVTDTHSEGEEGTSKRAGPGEETGQSHSGRRGHGAKWSLGSCSSLTEEKRNALLRMRPARFALRMLGGEARPPQLLWSLTH